MTDEHKSRAPNGYVPGLTIDDETFVESVAIIELLDDLFPEVELFPKKPRDRARCARSSRRSTLVSSRCKISAC